MFASIAQAESSCYVPMANNQPTPIAGDELTIYINADESESWGKGDISLRGDVELIQGNRLLKAEQAEYQQASQRIIAEGNISLSEEGLLLKGKRIVLDAQSEAASLVGGEYQMAGRSGRGAADEINIESRERILLNDASYTTCPPGDNTWRFNAGTIELLPEENLGIAKNMRLEVLGVPVLYLPYINFPLGDRKSGLLAPSIGSSDVTGRELKVPFYWNIAPDRDATFALRYMSQRGTQLGGEFRYLNERGNGKLDVEYLDQDEQLEQARHFVKYQQQSFWQAWQSEINIQQVSDRNYFRELSSDKQRLSSSLLESSARLDYRDDEWYFALSLQYYQRLDERLLSTQQPTRRLPQLRFARYFMLGNSFKFTTEGEFAHFQQVDGFNALRLDFKQKVSRYFGDRAAYIKPTVAWQGTSYWLDGNGEPEPSQSTRQLPMLSVDTGLWLERSQRVMKKHYRQSLEPRIYYLHVPYRDQATLPQQGRLFDSQLSEFDFDSLFNENRYSGVDRVGDEQRLTLSLGSRWFDEHGRQRLRARIGQVYHFADQRVALEDDVLQIKGWSNLLAAIDGRINRFVSSNGLVEWNDREQRLEKAGIFVVFERQSKRRVALGLNYRREILKQGTIQLRWPLDSRWSMMGDVSHSFHDNETRNAQLGLEYDDCCWRVRLAAQQYISDNNGSRNSGVAVQFELKGLTSVGSKISGFAESEAP